MGREGLLAASVTTARAVATVSQSPHPPPQHPPPQVGWSSSGLSVADSDDFAFEAEILAHKRMIEVHDHMVGCNIKHLAGDAESVACHHWDIGVLLDSLGIKLSVDHKDVFVKTGHIVGIIGKPSPAVDRNVKCLPRVQALRARAQGENESFCHPKIKRSGLFVDNVVDKSFGPVGSDFKEVIAYFDIFAGENFSIIILSFVLVG